MRQTNIIVIVVCTFISLRRTFSVVRDADGQQIAYIYYSNEPNFFGLARRGRTDSVMLFIYRTGETSWLNLFPSH